MKVSFLSLLFVCLISNVAMADTAKSVPANAPLDLSEIFYNDNENQLLFIDFQAIGDQVSLLNILKDDELMMEDDVSDLPDNTIYELNLEVLRNGNYTVELVCKDGIKIRKEIVIE